MIKNSAKVLVVDMMSGANDYGVELCCSLSKFVDLTVVTVDNSPLEATPELKVIKCFPAFGGRAGKLQKAAGLLSAYAKLISELWRHRNGIVHIQFFRFPFLDLLVYLAAGFIVKNMVYTAHNALPHERRYWSAAIYRLWYRGVDGIHVLSENAKSEICRVAGGRTRNKIFVIPHGNYERLFVRTGGAEKIGRTRDGGSLVGLQFGLVRPYKGVDLLVRSAAHLPQGCDVTFRIVGGGDPGLIEEYRQLAGELGVSSRFTFKNTFLSDDELALEICDADFLVFPYRNIYQSGALMLAMTFGKPIIANDIPGLKEYAFPDCALFVDAEDGEQFSRMIEALEGDRRLRHALGAAAFSRAWTRYNWSNIAAAMERMYLQVAKRDFGEVA